VTTEQKVLLVEQYRIPVHTRTIELPPVSSEMNRVARANRLPLPPFANCWRKLVMPPGALSQ
jgi:hypothetical protein